MVDAFGLPEHKSLGALRELGFTFSMDRVARLDFSAEALARLGFGFVEVDCDLLLNRSTEARADPRRGPEQAPWSVWHRTDRGKDRA